MVDVGGGGETGEGSGRRYRWRLSFPLRTLRTAVSRPSRTHSHPFPLLPSLHLPPPLSRPSPRSHSPLGFLLSLSICVCPNPCLYMRERKQRGMGEKGERPVLHRVQSSIALGLSQAALECTPFGSPLCPFLLFRFLPFLRCVISTCRKEKTDVRERKRREGGNAWDRWVRERDLLIPSSPPFSLTCCMRRVWLFVWQPQQLASLRARGLRECVAALVKCSW